MDEKLVKQEIQKLVEKFERIKREGKYKKYNEENTKKDFILPLFRALGWNVEDSDEVKAEEKVSKKRVDYAFRINGVPKFYLECKPFREFISEPKYAKQAIEYAWNKSVTWAVLCNFEGIRVFNAEWKWDDKQPMRNQFLDLRYTDYTGSCFKYLIWLSRESFEQGILDKQATILGKKAKKLPIDQQLLADFTGYRNLLSKDILKNNQKMNLSQDELDEIVQRVLDRIIFIRTCEDKEIESEKLESLVRIYGDKEGKLYRKLNEKFREYDDGYNSKLFLEHLCEKVVISNDVLKEVILGTYRSKNLDIRYDFSAINADVLGNIYEQYLGHILKSTSKRAKITNGKVHRKQQGIYYTPTYIVDYIVRNTLGEKLKKRGVKVDQIKILDPACGSGSFLLKAFDILSEHVSKKEGAVQQTRFEDAYKGSPQLLKRKTEILKKCIFGVDLDPQAVEIAQLNLLLKLAEKRHRLPTLQENIKCGNSLIDDPSVAGDKAFKWEEEFKEIMEKGGFDVVIGNPPYVRVDSLDKNEKMFWKNNFSVAQGKYDVYYLFLEISFNLVKKGGLIGFIVPNKFCAATSASNLRNVILNNSTECTIYSVSSLDVFKDARNYPVIIIIKKGKYNRRFSINYTENQKDFVESRFISYKITKRQFDILPSKIFPINISQKEFDIVIRLLAENKKLSDYMQISEGLRIPREYEEKTSSDYEIVKQYQFTKWSPISKGSSIQLSKLKKVVNNSSKRYTNIMRDKILIAEDALSISATIDTNMRIPQGGVYFGTVIGKEPLKYLLGLLNSKLLSFVYQILFGGMHMGGGYLRYRSEFLYSLPIKFASESQQKSLIKLVDKMLFLNKRLNEIGDKKTDERAKIEEEIRKTDKKIDELVYKIYGLTKNEIAIVEESLKE